MIKEHRYVIAEEIGRGGSCIVYNGFYRDRIGERHLVKIKECYPYRLEIERDAEENLTPDLSCKQTFLAEKQKFLEAYRKNTALKTTLGLVNSTANATNIYEYHNTCYVVMTEIEGRDYRSEADENLQSLFLHLRTLARIVKKYHDCGMLHLDIKPENVLLIPETKEQMVLFDFDSMVRHSQMVGHFLCRTVMRHRNWCVENAAKSVKRLMFMRSGRSLFISFLEERRMPWTVRWVRYMIFRA